MDSSLALNRMAIYVMVSHRCEVINKRVGMLLSLARRCGDVTLVCSGEDKIDEGLLSIKPYLNPTGIFRVIGLRAIKRKIDKYLYFPSTTILYSRRAERKLRDLIERDIRQGRQVCLITCVPHHDQCMAGLHLKQRFRQMHWIIDWQDLWSYDESYLNRIPDIYREKLISLEKSIFNSSDINVTTNEFARNVLINQYHVPPSRVVSISHHFSRDDVDSSVGPDKILVDDSSGRVIRIGYLGTLFKPPKVPGDKVVQTFRRLSETTGGKVELHVYGDMSRSKLKDEIGTNVGSIIFHKRTGHIESLKNIARCDFLLLVLEDLPNSRAIMHQKLPHYLLLGKPILAIVPEDSAVAQIVRETNSGFVIPSSDDWGSLLGKIFEHYAGKYFQYKPNMDAIEAYSQEFISKKWLSLIENQGNIVR